MRSVTITKATAIALGVLVAASAGWFGARPSAQVNGKVIVGDF